MIRDYFTEMFRRFEIAEKKGTRRAWRHLRYLILSRRKDAKAPEPPAELEVSLVVDCRLYGHRWQR